MRKWKEDLENGNTQKRSTTESGNLHHMNRKGKIICFDTFLTCNEVKGVTTYGATTWLKMKALVERRKSYSAYMFNSQSQPEPEPEPMNEEVCAQCELPGYYLGEAHSCQGIVSGISVELPPIQNNFAGNSSKKDNNVISETKTERDKGVYLGVEDDDMAKMMSLLIFGKRWPLDWKVSRIVLHIHLLMTIQGCKKMIVIIGAGTSSKRVPGFLWSRDL